MFFFKERDVEVSHMPEGFLCLNRIFKQSYGVNYSKQISKESYAAYQASIRQISDAGENAN